MMRRDLLSFGSVILSGGQCFSGRNRRISWMEGNCWNDEILQSSRKTRDFFRMTHGALTTLFE